jgi:predicted Zn-dependent protease
MQTPKWWVIITYLFIGVGLSANGQISCGTPAMSPLEKKELSRYLHTNQKNLRRSNYAIAVNAVIVHPDNELSSFGNDEINQLISNANNYFKNIGIQFFLKNGFVQNVHNSDWQDFETSEEQELRKENDRLDAMNIYFVKNITNADGLILNGYSNLPGYNTLTNRLIFSYQDNSPEDFISLKSKTFLHELGHYFGLLHTFQNSNSEDISERELVTRGKNANCGYTGDELCDTPADPFELLKSISALNCSTPYPNTLVDAGGEQFVSSFDNIMSYHLTCGDEFTEQQYQRMEASLGIRLSPKAEYQIAILDHNFISIKPFDKKIYCSGENITLHLANSGVFNEKNSFYAEITDENGENFNGISALVFNDSLKIKLPDNLKSGLNYRFRVFSSQPNIYSFPTAGIQVNTNGNIKMSTPTPMINRGDSAELNIKMDGNGPWNFSLSNGSKFENISTSELSIFVQPDENSTFSISDAQNTCKPEVEKSEVHINVVEPNIKIENSFESDICKNSLVKIPVKGLNINSIGSYSISLIGLKNSFTIKPSISAYFITFPLPDEVNGEEIYNFKIIGKGLVDYSLSKEIRIKSIPPKPKIISPLSYCYNAPIGKLIAEGASLKWYYNSEDDEPFEEITPNTSVQGRQYYYVSQTSINGCESERSEIVVGIKPPVTADISGDNTILIGDSTKISIQLTGEPPWQLALNSGTDISTNNPTYDFYVKPSNSTSYTLKKVNNVCGNRKVLGEANVVVLIPLGTNEPKKEKLSVYPIPANDFLNIDLNSNYSGEGQMKLQNILGQNIVLGSCEVMFHNGKTRLFLSNLPAGYYILKTELPDQNFINQIIVR